MQDEGEAIILNLKGRPTVFILPVVVEPSGGIGSFYGDTLLQTFGFTTGWAVFSNDEFRQVRQLTGKRPMVGVGGGLLPVFAAFRDEQVPNTIYEINPRDMAAQLGPGVKFIGIDLEITKEPITKGELVKRLPWLAPGHPMANKFNRDPPGQQRAMSDRPLSYKFGNKYFFGTAAW